jgi:serine protease Do
MSLFEKMRKQKLLSFSLLLLTLCLGILIGTLVNTDVRAERDQVAPDAKPLAIPSPVELSTAFTELAKRLEPSVVNITTEYGIKQPEISRDRRQQRPEEQTPEFDFFRRFFGNPLDLPQQPFRRVANGSGTVVDPNGYILTNYHVVEKADRITVRLNGDRKGHKAKLIGTDRETDLAIIKIETGKKLTPARIGNSDAVQVGDWAVAIGSPFNLETTVTAGIISAKDRPGREQFQHFLQTDAAINPGNSGGPLLNIKGEVIGINTAIATTSRGYEGVGFALPINTAVKVYNEIIKTGRVTRGSIGVGLKTHPTPELLKVYGADHGAFVSAVERGSPAGKAGVKAGDVIVAMNGKTIRDGDDLVNAVSDSEVGSEAELGVIRDGKKRNFRVTIGDRTKVWAGHPSIGGPSRDEPSQGEATEVEFGLGVRTLTEADKERLGFSGDGVRITRVDPASFAEDIGLQANDIIIKINRQPIHSVGDIERIQRTLRPGDPVALQVMRLSPLQRRGERRPEWTSRFFAGRLPADE